MRMIGALLLMAASGFSALGLQIVWTQQSAAWLGHESAAMLGVVTAFFGGLALGSLAFGPAIQRSPRPLRWYVVCEAAVVLWSLVLLVLITPAGGALMALTGVQPTPAWQWGIAFGGTLLLLLPATACMGATLPAMERVLATSLQTRDTVAALYAANTLGAVLGVLAAAFWLVPGWGLTRTAAFCACLNLACAGLAWWALRPNPQGPASCTLPPQTSATGLPLVLAATGCLGIGYEVLVVRALSQAAENTVYTFALVLAVYLAGTAAGAALLHLGLRGREPGTAVRDGLLLSLALACLLGAASLWGLLPMQSALRDAFGPGMTAALASEAALALVVFGLPTLVMGALFSVLARQAAAAGLGLGRALGYNTLGAACAPPVLGVLLLPAAGAKVALLLVALAYLALLSRQALRAPPAWVLVGAGTALFVWAPPLMTVDLPEGGQVVHFEEGAMAAVSVVQHADGVQTLHIDNRQQEGSSHSAFADGRQALLPLLMHPAPRQALFLGLGTGVTAAAALQDRDLKVHVVELLPEVVRAAALFTPALADAALAPRLQVQVADARRFVRAGAQAGPAYDVVVADNFHPARSGSAALYTVEHFQAVKARLAPQGLFCQWLPVHQLDIDTLRIIVRAFTSVYPGAMAVLATHSLDTPVLGLLARADGGGLSLAAVRQRLSGPRLDGAAAASGLADEWALLGMVVAGPGSLRRWSEAAPLNTDDHPVVAYRAPRITYAPDSRPRDRLFELLDGLSARPADVLADTSAVEAERLAAYWSARNRFLHAGRHVRVSADPRRMLAQVQTPLLEVLTLSPDFRPAYEPLLRLAQALEPHDPERESLLQRLEQLVPQAKTRAAVAAGGPR